MSGDSQAGGFDFGALLSQLGQVQQNLQHAQEEAAAEEVEGSSGGGAVKVTVSGALEFRAVKIDRSVVDPDDVEMLEDLVLAAVRDGLEKASSLATSALGGAGLGGLGGLPGLGSLPGLSGAGLGSLPGLGGLGPGRSAQGGPESGDPERAGPAGAPARGSEAGGDDDDGDDRDGGAEQR